MVAHAQMTNKTHKLLKVYQESMKKNQLIQQLGGLFKINLSIQWKSMYIIQKMDI